MYQKRFWKWKYVGVMKFWSCIFSSGQKNHIGEILGHQYAYWYSWNSKVEKTWISLIVWPHKMSSIYVQFTAQSEFLIQSNCEFKEWKKYSLDNKKVPRSRVLYHWSTLFLLFISFLKNQNSLDLDLTVHILCIS